MEVSRRQDIPLKPRKNRVRISSRCVCLQPGSFNCGISGILAGLPQANGVRYVERCDTCKTFASDAAACKAYTLVHGGWCGYDLDLQVVWVPL